MGSSLFSEIPLAPKDPILGVTELFVADTRPGKANLGVGVYYDEDGKLPLLRLGRQRRERPGRGPRGPRLSTDRRHQYLQQGGSIAAA